MDPKGKHEKASGGSPLRRPDCVKCFDTLWFCYSPWHQMQCYYRDGDFDPCFGKWSDLFDCLWLKTKRAVEADEILAERERTRPCMWAYRTVDEASEHWQQMYKHLAAPPSSDAPPPASGGGS